MHTELWDDTYKELENELGRKPANKEVQKRMLENMFGGQDNEKFVDKVPG